MDRYQMNRQGINRQGYSQYRANRTNCDANNCSAPAPASEPSGCGCDTATAPVDEMALAMGYIPMQRYNTTFEPCKALRVGTVFPELCKQFVGKRGKKC